MCDLCYCRELTLWTRLTIQSLQVGEHLFCASVEDVNAFLCVRCETAGLLYATTAVRLI